MGPGGISTTSISPYRYGIRPTTGGFDYAYGHSGSLDMAPYVYVENGSITAEVDSITEDTGKYTWWRKEADRSGLCPIRTLLPISSGNPSIISRMPSLK